MKSWANSRLFWIVSLVVAFHLGLFLLLADKKPLPERPYIPPPNFSVQQMPITDPNTGEKLIYREFTVSTKLPEEEARPTAAVPPQIP